MTVVRRADLPDVGGIARVCSEGWRDTYAGIYDAQRIEAVITEFYNPERVAAEVTAPDGWDGWLVAIDDGEVVGAGGGGMIDSDAGEVFVLYLDPQRRREGIGSMLLAAITQQQRAHGAREQWVPVERENEKGLPFYSARGFESAGERPAWGSAGESSPSLRLVRRLD